MKFRTNRPLSVTNKQFFMLPWLSDFVVCSTSLLFRVMGSTFISEVKNIM